MKGKIDNIKINNLNDGRSYATLSIGGQRYSLWNKEYMEELNKGDMIEYDFKQSGKYKNITDISEHIKNSKPDSQDNDLQNYISKKEYNNNGINNEMDDFISPELKKDREIVRMSCIKSAIYLTKDLGRIDLDKKSNHVINTAKKFENYITNFDDLSFLSE